MESVVKHSVKGNKVEQDDVIDLLQYWKIVNKFKWRILGFAFVVTFLCALVVFTLTPKYSTSATLLIEAQQAKTVSIEEVYGLDSTRNEYFLTQFEILKSKSLSEKVIHRLELTDKAEFAGDEESFNLKSWIKSLIPFLPKKQLDDESSAHLQRLTVLDNFSDKLSISPVRKTQLVKISFESEDPKLAAQVVNTLGDTYIESHLEAKMGITRKAADWLNIRLDDLKTRLDDSEQKLEKFTLENDLSVVRGVTGLSGSRLESLEQQLLVEEQKRGEAYSLYSIVTESGRNNLSLLESLEEVTSNRTIQDFKKEEILVQSKVSELSKVYGPKHPKMISAIAELNSISQKLQDEITNLVSNAENMLATSDKRLEQIKNNLTTARAEHQANRILDNDYRRLKREVDTNRSLYDTFMERTKETSIAADFDSAHARFTDRAIVPVLPSKPRKGMIIGLAFIAAIGIGIMLAFVIDALNDSFRNAADIESYLGMRLLGLLPLMSLKKDQDVPVHAFYESEHKSFSEAIRTLRTGFTLTNIDKPAQVIEITSSVPNEGKTTCSINMAFSLAQMESVLLIDADMRRPSIGRQFGLPNYQPGLANIIAGTDKIEDCIHRDEKSGVDVITAGTIPPNPLELLSSKRFDALIQELKNKYDRIVIDMAPTQAVSDALVVAKLADVVLYVVRSDSTRHKVAKNGVGRLLEVNANIGGVILNQVDINKKDSQYGYYGYYDYYGYSDDNQKSKNVKAA